LRIDVMRKILLFSFLVSLAPITGFSQYELNHTLNRSEYTGALGLSQLLGDLGGSPQIGTHFLRDFNPGAIRYGGYLGYRRRVSHAWSFKFAVTLADLYGNDALTSNPYRHNRNQDVRTFLVEPSVQAEYHFYQYDQPGHRYKIRHAHGFRTLAIDAYLFVGVGGFYFNPQGKYDGTWYNLRPLSTEGEGLPGGPSTYSPFGLSFPAGIGVKYLIDIQWSVGLELSDRLWTSSDYIDDTHGNYFSPAEIGDYKGPIASSLSHPVLGLIPGQDLVGTERGDDKYNDSYMFIFFTVNYRPNPYHRRRSRAKF
jgi:hypothetical protein